MLRTFFSKISLLLLLPLVCLPGGLKAQTEEKQAQGVDILTETSASEPDSTDLKNIVIPELYLLAKAGEIQLESVPNLNYEWRYDDEWIRNSMQGSAENIRPENLKPEFLQKRGFIAGVAASINEETSPTEAANRVLWNIRSTFWSERAIDSAVRMVWLKEGVRLGDVRWNWKRAYIKQLLPQDKTQQVFRELFKVIEPKTLLPFGFLTFRFLGTEEDFLWISSAATKKVRQLTGSNRTDSLLHSDAALDDLLLWSGKPELVEAKIDRTVRVLAPLASTHLTPLAKFAAGEAGCLEVTQTSDSGAAPKIIRWPFDGAQEGGKAAPSFNNTTARKSLFIFPSSAVFTTRDLWRIELISKDPYALYGRQVLYVDPIMMLPLYKVVFDLSGRLWKVAIGGFGLAAVEEGKGQSGKGMRVPYPSFTVVVDLVKRQTTILDYERVAYCDNFTEKVALTDFDPYKLAPAPESPAPGKDGAVKSKKSAERKATEPMGEVDER